MNNKFDLNGEWSLRWADQERGGYQHKREEETDEYKAISAIVPGEVHLDLIRAGIIEEPTLGTNSLASRWVEESLWTYKKVFEAPKGALESNAWLNFEGLDYDAKIYLNGELVGQHSNFFYPCKINITNKLKAGENILVVQIQSGVFSVPEKSVKGYFGGRYDTTLSKRIWLRKPQCSFSWDWSPQLLNVGIYKSVYIEWEAKARVDQLVVLADLNNDLTMGAAKIRLVTEGLKDENQKGKLFVKILETNQEEEFEVAIDKGKQILEKDFLVSHPKLWWPIGQGEQNLYTVNVALYINDEKIAEQNKKVGFRKVVINQEPNPKGGNNFIIEINHRKIFAKGANFVPADIIYARIDRRRYETLIERAIEANFNMLRVWAGGLYESDDFYELCDEKGIIVWQEFIFACAAYPTNDEAMMKNIKAEVTYNIRRLANHASLVIWCGNNEQEWLTYNQEEGVIYPDYALYHHVIPRILREEDPNRYYQASSPISPDNMFPNRDDMGDQHPWNIGFENVDFHQYRNMICRFPNEGGILGPTSLKSMEACLPMKQKHWNSFAWQLHDNSVEQWYKYSAPDNVVRFWINKEPKDMSIEEYTYYGGLIQGEGLSEYINNFRRRKYDCASAIFWMYNDCWPAVRSWTIVDYYLNRTPSFYPVSRAFAPISVVVAKEDEDVNIYGINDTPEDFQGELRYGLFTLTGEYIIDISLDVKIPTNTSTVIASFKKDAWDKAGVDKAIAFAMLSKDGKTVARNRLILPRFYELEWPSSNSDFTNVSIIRDGDEIVFKSSSFIWGVCIDLMGEEKLDDNFFDLWPGIEYRISWDRNKKIPRFITPDCSSLASSCERNTVKLT
jgi:beta-mannosidase